MGHIKDKAKKPIIKAPNTILREHSGCSSDQHPLCSFRYITSNNKYCLDYCTKLDTGEKVITLLGLFSKIEEISQHPWLHWQELPKAAGLETIEYSNINFTAGKSLTKDEKMIVFRFDTHLGTKKGRIIGFKESPCSAFYIIGFDFTFDAYDHG